MASLSDKERMFVEAYLQLWNATAAARKAGYSEKTARQQGSRLLTKVDIRQEIETRLAEVAMGANEVLARLAQHARASMADFIEVDDEGKPDIDLSAAKEHGLLHMIKKVEIEPTRFGTTYAIEVYDAQAALVHLGRHHGLFKDRDPSDILKYLDLTKLSDEQLERLSNGEDIYKVLLNK